MIRPRRWFMPLVLLAEVLLFVLLLVALPVSLLGGLADRRLRATRLLALALTYLLLQWGGLIVLGGVTPLRWLRSPADWSALNTRILASLLAKVIGAARRTVGFHLRVDPPPGADALEGESPVLVFARHGGPGDSFVLVWLLAARFRRPPRIVLKEVLRWEPLIDVALSRLGAVFLPPANRREDRALADEVAALATALTGRDALLIFPEGANWTPSRRQHVLRRLWARGRSAELRAAALMDSVLPPRVAGVEACLNARPELPVVVVAHAGLDRLTSSALLWAAIPFGAPMRVRWWPPAPCERDVEEWLRTEWAIVDEWVTAQTRL